ncbi:MAG: hypothetical protein A2096_09080 [Spirochaetes bacterium GWF1_41_5]|nr:MAG: hypothetical protein A2096_09080 [Spirochaetes bacterium GWF1_41_5]HBE01324.1 hypothetical protein [Spirochaetia bacterium]
MIKIILSFFIFLSWLNSQPADLSPLIHPPIMSPVPDGVKQEIPPELGNKKLAAMGVLDVTAAPFFADSTGKKDSTRALQQAIDTARDAQMICYFPPGKYTVSDTLLCVHGIHLRSHKKAAIQFKNMPVVLQGASHWNGQKTDRPKIILAPRSAGFSDPAGRKYVIEYRIYNIKNKFEVDTNQSAWSMLMRDMIINLDLEIGEGNPGAVGVLMRSVEGAAIQDFSIDATHGFIGIEGSAANGGSWANIKITGGVIGLDMSGWSAPTPTMEGITLIDQQTPILIACRGSLAAAGLDIRTKSKGPLIVQKNASAPFDSTMNIIDSRIVCESPGTVVFGKPVRSIYLNNVFVYNAGEIVSETLPGKSQAWIKISEFALGNEVKSGENIFTAPVYINSEKRASFPPAVSAAEPPADLCSRHLWNENFPLWDHPSAVNIKNPPYNAKGNSMSDDTAAIQKAVDENEMILIPKGYFRVSKTIKLKPNSKLIGIAHFFSVLTVRDPAGHFGNEASPQPVIETADDKNAETFLSFVYLMVPEELPASSECKNHPVYALKWMCGKKSVFRNVLVEPERIYGFIGSKEHKSAVFHHPQVLISGNGGGKWYNYHTSHGWKEETPESLCIKIENTSEPLFFYNFEPQISLAKALAEIKNSRNITFLGCKTELTGTFMRVNNSENIRIFGHGGVGTGDKDKPLYVFEDTENFIITTISEQININPDKAFYGNQYFMRNFSIYSPLAEIRKGKLLEIPSAERPVMYKRGNPSD